MENYDNNTHCDLMGFFQDNKWIRTWVTLLEGRREREEESWGKFQEFQSCRKMVAVNTSPSFPRNRMPWQDQHVRTTLKSHKVWNPRHLWWRQPWLTLNEMWGPFLLERWKNSTAMVSMWNKIVPVATMVNRGVAPSQSPHITSRGFSLAQGEEVVQKEEGPIFEEKYMSWGHLRMITTGPFPREERGFLEIHKLELKLFKSNGNKSLLCALTRNIGNICYICLARNKQKL